MEYPAQSRVQHLQQQIADCDDPARRDALTAQLRQAELKFDDARKKLDELERGISLPLDQRLQNVAQKVQASPVEAQRNAVATIEKRLAVAVEKMEEAARDEKPTLAALTQGVEKLKQKLADAQAELAEMEKQPEAPVSDQTAPQQDAAAAAIARAQAKAAAAANMSAEEKHAEQRQSLRVRAEKARAKLAEAEASGSEHVAALRTGLEKLEAKML